MLRFKMRHCIKFRGNRSKPLLRYDNLWLFSSWWPFAILNFLPARRYASALLAVIVSVRLSVQLSQIDARLATCSTIAHAL